MFWDYAAGLYDLFENQYNGKVNYKLVGVVASMIEKEDLVLECACGTGMISKGIAKKAKSLIATDYSEGMLKQARKNLSGFDNVLVQKANIMELDEVDDTYDKVVAGNVIHLLDEPAKAIEELLRVCKSGGKIIIPTYVNNENAGSPNLFVKMLEKFGAGFKCQFDYKSYQEFYKTLGYNKVTFDIVEGKMPCAIAIITKE